MTISVIGTTSAPVTAATTSATPTSQATGTAAQAQFMSLLLAQMKNQDPTAPMSNSDMSTQMSQLNMVTGINKLNATMDTVASGLQSSQTTQAASLLGKNVLVPGTNLALSNGQSQMGVELAKAVDSLTVTISDSTGNVVQTMNLGSQPVGTLNLAWDGGTNAGIKAADGDYTFQVAATSGGQSVTPTALATGTVANVTLSSAGAIDLSVPPVGNFSLADIRQIR
ncbi:MAG: basal-body rod modification protein FlgD [Pseudomonadota bacterium]|jgi:flagellar basal-body rod modification protein FlgD